MMRRSLIAVVLLAAGGIIAPAFSASAPGAVAPVTQAQNCNSTGVAVQVLGSGGPELQTKRASSSYLVWIDGKARVLVDTGGGSALRFGESGAQMADLDVLLFTHLHADHSADLPALIKSSWFEDRARPLPVYGPGGNRLMPSTVAFVRALFDGTRGAYRYLGEFISPLDKSSYKLEPRDVLEPAPKIGAPRRKEPLILPVFSNERVRVQAVSVAHGQLPALAFRIETGGKTIVFSGDTNGNGDGLPTLAAGADLLVAHNAVPEGAGGVERALHMPPSVIGNIAQAAKVKQLVLSHRMLRTLGKEEETLATIRKVYAGPTTFADDLSCYRP
jgi:ribonuclease BN (tRNA processing enzyme)